MIFSVILLSSHISSTGRLTDFRRVLGFQSKNKHSVRKPQGNGGDRWHFQTCYTAGLHFSRQFCCGSIAFPRAADVTPKAAFTCTGWTSSLSKPPPLSSHPFCSVSHLSQPSPHFISHLKKKKNSGYYLRSWSTSFQEGKKKERATITSKWVFKSNGM